MEIDTKLTDKKHWEDSYVDIEYITTPVTSEYFLWIKNHIPEAKLNETSFEVGIFPARYSTMFGNLGYEINGIDRIEAINTTMKSWLEKENYKTGDLICDDLFTHKFERKYNVVSSFGFIEHFKNFDEIIKLQSDLVADKGYIVIGVPNFRGKVQLFLKKLLDKKNLDVHYVPSMNFDVWEKVLVENNFEIIAKEYLGRFSFQTYPQDRNIFQKLAIKFLKKYRYFIKKHILNGVSKHYSPDMIMIARKK